MVSRGTRLKVQRFENNVDDGRANVTCHKMFSTKDTLWGGPLFLHVFKKELENKQLILTAGDLSSRLMQLFKENLVFE